jgi:hypothetical protein
MAGLLIGVNPFDEPNVKQAKDATAALLEAYRRDGSLPAPEAHAAVDGTRLTLSGALLSLGAAAPASLLASVTPGDYLALLAYVPTDDDAWAAALADARRTLAQASGVATTLGYGPRYLHSTGQLHKGGPDTGVFVVVAAEAPADVPVPGQPYSFGVLETAQAIGDFQSLDRLGRRAAYIRLPRAAPAALGAVIDALAPRAR